MSFRLVLMKDARRRPGRETRSTTKLPLLVFVVVAIVLLLLGSLLWGWVAVE